MKWVHIGEEIKYDWYELRCQLSQENHLQIFIEGLKNQKLKYCIDFGKILFCRSIDEGWNLNLLEEDWLIGPVIPCLSDGILLEIIDSHLKNRVQKFYLAPIYHYQVQGINFGIDVITEAGPIIKKLDWNQGENRLVQSFFLLM